MPFDGSGVFIRLRNWVTDATAGVKIRADFHDTEDDGFAQGLSQCIVKDGQSTITQNIPWNSKRITALADPIDPQDAATKHYVDIELEAALKLGLMVWNVPGVYPWTVPENCFPEVTVIGAGGGGGASGDGSGGGIAGNIGGGGGGGGFTCQQLTDLVAGSVVNVTVGAGGNGVTNGAGLAGGDSYFGTLLHATGGGGGGSGTQTVVGGGLGGTGLQGLLNVPGGSGGFSGPNSIIVTMSDVMRIYARGGPAAGGFSGVSLGPSGNSGVGYGMGGSGAAGGSGVAGGKGAPGLVIARW